LQGGCSFTCCGTDVVTPVPISGKFHVLSNGLCNYTLSLTMKCAIKMAFFLTADLNARRVVILYTPPPILLGRCYSDKISVQRITFNLRFTPTVGMKCNLGPTEDGSVEMSCRFITSFIRFANMTLLACHVQASTRIRSLSRDGGFKYRSHLTL
jgi:hypothetical protein